MSPRSEELNERMREEAAARLERSALREFAESGYGGASMRRIAEMAGTSLGLAYHYFPSKEALFGHIVDYALSGAHAALKAAMESDGDAWTRIESYAAAVAASLGEAETALYFAIIVQALTQGKAIPGLLARIDSWLKKIYALLEPAIVEAQEAGDAGPGDAHALASAYFALVQGLALLRLAKGARSPAVEPWMLTSPLRGAKGKEGDGDGR